MKKLLCLVIFVIVTLSSIAFAQAVKPCDGPADMCIQIQQLQKDLADQKTGKAVDVQAAKSTENSKAAKFVAAAAITAVLLKIIISFLNAWSDHFKSPRGKAEIKLAALVLGFVAFLLTNLGYGLPWWQAIIVAGGAPGAILVHEMVGLFPVIFQKPVPVPPPVQTPIPVEPAPPPASSSV